MIDILTLKWACLQSIIWTSFLYKKDVPLYHTLNVSLESTGEVQISEFIRICKGMLAFWIFPFKQ